MIYKNKDIQRNAKSEIKENIYTFDNVQGTYSTHEVVKSKTILIKNKHINNNKLEKIIKFGNI